MSRLRTKKTGQRNMINFLRALLPQLGIQEIEYLDTEQMGLSPEEGKSVFDLSVLTGDGSRRQVLSGSTRYCQAIAATAEVIPNSGGHILSQPVKTYLVGGLRSV